MQRVGHQGGLAGGSDPGDQKGGGLIRCSATLNTGKALFLKILI